MKTTYIRRRDLTEILAGRIAKIIVDECMPFRSHITAQELADRFHVSRSPVGRALQLLAARGAVLYERNCGYFTAEPSVAAAVLAELPSVDELSTVYFRLAEDRLSGELDDQVSESYLRERYSLGRAELAELLGRAYREGWVERRPGYGWSFSPILRTPEALEQTYRLRMAIEPAALLEPRFNLSNEDARRCRITEERLLGGAIETMSADELYERGVSFHETLVGASQNPFFLDALQRANRIRRLLAYRSMNDRSRYYSQAEEHLQILDLIERGRRKDAAAAMNQHLQSVIGNLAEIRPLLADRASRSAIIG